MLINNLLIEQFREVDGETVSARAALCTFHQPGYVGVRRTSRDETKQKASVTPADSRYTTKPFPERLLRVTSGRRPSFSYSEPWTVPPWTLNVIAPPSGFVAQSLRAEFLDDSGGVRFRPALDDGRLYYFALLQHANGDRVAFETRGRFEYDPAKAERQADRMDDVGSGRWQSLWAAVAAPLSTAGEIVGTAAAIKTILG